MVSADSGKHPHCDRAEPAIGSYPRQSGSGRRKLRQFRQLIRGIGVICGLTIYGTLTGPRDLSPCESLSVRDAFFAGLDPDFSGMVSMHLWAHLWWDRSRRDFSTFHSGLLTQDYVRRANTTYAVAARRFLPAPGIVPEPAGSVVLDRACDALAAIDWRLPLRRLRRPVRRWYR